MPWHIEKHDDGYFVVNSHTGKLMNKKPHDSKGEANAQLRALYTNVPDATKEIRDITDVFMEAFKGGVGSGNFGHAGRPGKKGGSAGGKGGAMGSTAEASARGELPQWAADAGYSGIGGMTAGQQKRATQNRKRMMGEVSASMNRVFSVNDYFGPVINKDLTSGEQQERAFNSELKTNAVQAKMLKTRITKGDVMGNKPDVDEVSEYLMSVRQNYFKYRDMLDDAGDEHEKAHMRGSISGMKRGWDEHFDSDEFLNSRSTEMSIRKYARSLLGTKNKKRMSGGDYEYENAMDMGRSMESDGFGAGRGQREPLGEKQKKEVSTAPTGVPAHGPGGLYSMAGMGGAYESPKKRKIKVKNPNRNIKEEAEMVGKEIRRKMRV